MTTSVFIYTQGNKQVSVNTPSGEKIISPNTSPVMVAAIHGEQEISIKETGEFIDLIKKD